MEEKRGIDGEMMEEDKCKGPRGGSEWVLQAKKWKRTCM